MSDTTLNTKEKSKFNLIEIIKSNSKLSLISGAILILFGFFLLFKGWSLAAANDASLPDDFGIYWMATFAAFLIGFLNVFVKDGLTKSTYISRIIVGSLFVVSGLIKANDPIGFSIKLQEYFEPTALNFPSLMYDGWPIFLSILISGLEIVLGLAVLLGGLFRISVWALLGMILFFGWLTHHTANCLDNSAINSKVEKLVEKADKKFFEKGGLNSAERKLTKAKELFDSPIIDKRFEALKLIRSQEYVPYQDTAKFYISKGADTIHLETVHFPQKQCVDDCGCFGDALKGSIGRSLTAWESFLKDLVLFILIIPILLTQNKTKFNNNKDDMILLSGGIIFSLLMGVQLFGWWFPTIFMLLFFAGYLAIKKWILGKDKQEWISALFAIIFSFSFVLYTYSYLPVKDYRGYAIGNSIKEQMSNGEDKKYQSTLYYYNIETKEIEKYSENEYYYDSVELTNLEDTALYNNPKLASNGKFYVMRWDYLNNPNLYEFEDNISEVIKEGSPNTIQDFGPFKLYGELTNIEKNNSIIDSIIASKLPEFVDSVIIMEDVNYGYLDTLTADLYDSTYYPLSDSTYKTNGWQNIEKQPLSLMQVEFTDYLLSLDEVIWIVAYSLTEEKGDSIYVDDKGVEVKGSYAPTIDHKNEWNNMKALVISAQEAGMPIYLMTASTDAVVAQFKQETGIDIDVIKNDGTELKIIIRSNPGIVYLEKGVIKNKWDYNRIPIFENLK